jgi:hypothetical protein
MDKWRPVDQTPPDSTPANHVQAQRSGYPQHSHSCTSGQVGASRPAKCLIFLAKGGGGVCRLHKARPVPKALTLSNIERPTKLVDAVAAQGQDRMGALTQEDGNLRSYPHSYRVVCFVIAAGLMLPGATTVLAEAAGTGPAINKKEMPGYCRNMAVEMFAVKPNKVKLKKLVEGTSDFSVPGAADQGNNGTRAFHCTFDAEGRFVEMVVETQGVE